jgi:pimeloyl-ACP methyl ester carboxylesterase
MSRGAALRRARVSGGEFAYVDVGEGPAVVLLHGFPTSSFLWRDVIPDLAADMRVLAPDLLGYGHSEKPGEAALHPRAQAGYVRELLTQVGVEEFACVGHEIGGVVAQLLALDGTVRTLALLDTPAFKSWPIEGVRMLQEATPDQETPELAHSVIDLAFQLGMTNPGTMADGALEAYRAPFAGQEGAHSLFRAIRGIDGVGLIGTEGALGALDVRTLLLWGEDDPYQGVEVAERLAEALARPTLVLLPGCGHYLPEEAPETVTPLVAQFLRANYLGRRHGHEHDHPSGAGPVVVRLERRRGTRDLSPSP